MRELRELRTAGRAFLDQIRRFMAHEGGTSFFTSYMASSAPHLFDDLAALEKVTSSMLSLAMSEVPV
ncbi:MAG TPA: hypothetical protein VGL71_01795 [Urbifossiella sp.]|jgi:hypothetical protein